MWIRLPPVLVLHISSWLLPLSILTSSGGPSLRWLCCCWCRLGHLLFWYNFGCSFQNWNVYLVCVGLASVLVTFIEFIYYMGRIYLPGSYLVSSEFGVPSADGTNLFSVYTCQEVSDKVQQGIMYRPNANRSPDSYWKCNREQVEFYANR